MIRALLLATQLLAPVDCQRTCLYGSRCFYSWWYLRCEDSRVVHLGEWNPIYWGYKPPREQDFPAWVIPYPRPWGSYPLEQPRENHSAHQGHDVESIW